MPKTATKACDNEFYKARMAASSCFAFCACVRLCRFHRPGNLQLFVCACCCHDACGYYSDRQREADQVDYLLHGGFLL